MATGSGGKNPSCGGAAGTLAARTKFCDAGAVVATTSDSARNGGAGAAALKLEANKIAAMESRATERVIWSAEARAELFWRFFILCFLYGRGRPGVFLQESGRRFDGGFIGSMIALSGFPAPKAFGVETSGDVTFVLLIEECGNVSSFYFRLR